MSYLYKIRYVWYEGEVGEQYVVSSEHAVNFETLLKSGIKFVSSLEENNIGLEEPDMNKFSVRCLPEAFDKLIKYLEDNGCLTVYYDEYIVYYVDDDIRKDFKVERRTTSKVFEDI